jgi:hypothetical protein
MPSRRDHVSIIVAGPTASRPHTRALAPARAADGRAAPCARCRRGHVRRPTRPGQAGRATWHACALLGPPDAPTHPLSLAFARALLRAASCAHHCRRPELTGAPIGSSPLLEFKRRESLHLHPLDTLVHAHWPVDSPARRHCGRRGRPLPPSPPTLAGAVFRRANHANRPRVSPNPTLAAYSLEPDRPSPPACLVPSPGTSLRRLKSSQGPAYKN